MRKIIYKSLGIILAIIIGVSVMIIGYAYINKIPLTNFLYGKYVDANTYPFPNELIIDGGKLYCVSGDENNKKPDIGEGPYYSKELITDVRSVRSLVMTASNRARDKYQEYRYSRRCTTSIPASCSCMFTAI